MKPKASVLQGLAFCEILLFLDALWHGSSTRVGQDDLVTATPVALRCPASLCSVLCDNFGGFLADFVTFGHISRRFRKIKGNVLNFQASCFICMCKNITSLKPKTSCPYLLAEILMIIVSSFTSESYVSCLFLFLWL